MTLSDLYELVMSHGPMTAKEVHERVVKALTSDQDAPSYAAIHSRLRHGCNAGAIKRVDGRRGAVLYRAQPEWTPHRVRAPGGRIEYEQRDLIMAMRHRNPPASFAEIAHQLGVSASAAHKMYHRAIKDDGDIEAPPDPAKDFRVFETSHD